ncbi:phospholipid-transporting ATPase ABCA1-like [Wyeomyia smithii]|uniref:phospholipid-transporting ATPase ABCA1-like n=1 Tax=Wyeomyia smithii TaxID=174621 RepID=UPI002467BE3F|nr:phospholipid-transporting ATPase ABCA1-like [Wyeomyia smithii]XP_055529127.1 phospholipid-transporting ATPase ABCA1-like [Wyeomyia smithii]
MVAITAQGVASSNVLPQAEGTSDGAKFSLLLWKNFLLHWRSKLATLVEILIPPFFMLLLVGLRSLTEVQTNNYESIYEPLDITNFTGIKDNLAVPFAPIIAFSPDTDFLYELMKPVGNRTEMEVKGLPNWQELEYYLMASNAFVGVQFDDRYRKLTTLPIVLNYTLRFPGELRAQFGIMHTWRTNSRFASRPDGGARFYRYDDGGPSPGYFREGFLSIQHFIFQAYLEIVRDLQDEVVPDVVVQRFPYPPFLEDNFPSSLTTFLPISVMLAFIYPCISIVKSVLFEKEKQIKEAMKIMGLKNWILWSSWFVKCLLFVTISVSIVVLFLKVPWYRTPNVSVLTHSDWGVIWLFFFIYGIAIITFSFMLSTFFSKANSGGAVAAVIWFLAFAPYTVMDQDYSRLTAADKLAASLLLNSGIGFGLRLIAVYEGLMVGMQWSSLFHDSEIDNINLGSIMLMLLANSVIYMLIALYVEKVFPGDFGLAEPWYFPFSRRYWCGDIPPKESANSDPLPPNGNIEPEPKGRAARIEIRGLRKVYSNKKVAVEGLSFNMFEGQITALLGHNGAGKTTTMSMLTGMIRPSSGTAIVWGHDIRYDMKRIRNSLGYCPQHNILFDRLTVKEHLYFYGRLKGLSKIQVQSEIDRYIKCLELVDKTDVRASSLSGGMKRKLCVGIALCAGSKVVLCDEPTSGMDPAARRALWDLLIAEKSRRTMILSTHFMDEADMLGDRIAIMADGKLRAVGSSFFLKKRFGVGYRLICVKSQECDVGEVTELLRKYIPGLIVESSIGTELSYLLEEENSTHFQPMLEDLESNVKRLNILDFGISLTTLEEVFMKVGSDSVTLSDAESVSSIATASTDLESNSSIQDYNLLEGFQLFVCQMKALFLKKVYQTYRNWFLFIIQIVIPMLFVAVTIAVVRAWVGSRDMPSRLLSIMSHNPSVTVVQTDPDGGSELSQNILSSFLYHFEFTQGLIVDLVYDYIVRVFLNHAERDLIEVNRHFVIGATILDENCTAWFNNEALHSPAISLSVMHNALLRTFTQANIFRIDVTNHPLPYTDETRLQMSRAHNNLGFQLAYNTGFGMSFVSGFYVIFYIRERVTKAKLLQMVCGVNRFFYWLTGFLWDYFTYTIVCLFIIATIAVFQEPGFSTGAELFRMYSIFLFIGLPALPLAYITTLYYSVPPAAFIRVSVAFIVTGTALFIFVFLLGTDMFELVDLSETLSSVFLIFPHFALCDAIVSLSRMSVTINMCESERPPGVTPLPICNEDLHYFQWDRPGIGRHLYYSLVMTVVYFGLLFLLDFKVLKVLVQKAREWYYRGQHKLQTNCNEIDSDVQAEKQRVERMTETERSETNLVAHQMTKYYNRFLAVNQLSVGIKSYECFGLLGANGAGKTTTFKMLSGDETISFGNAWIKGNSLKSHLKKVHKHIGYCPQFDALIDDLTGRETLKLFSLLRGVPGDKIPEISNFLAREFGFARHLDKQVKAYSGGNKRKLSTALALLGNPSVVYLDEPTSGMDPGAKRNLWNGVCRVRDSGKTIVLTSHSMEECEALCTRLAIMVNGEFKCIGSTQHLKNKFSQGFVLIIKAAKVDSNEKVREAEESVAPDLQRIKDFISTQFPDSELKEEYQDLLTYYIRSQHLKWSQIFGIMEGCKRTLNVEDYSIGQTSLEQVFLSFTKFQREV